MSARLEKLKSEARGLMDRWCETTPEGQTYRAARAAPFNPNLPNSDRFWPSAWDWIREDPDGKVWLAGCHQVVSENFQLEWAASRAEYFGIPSRYHQATLTQVGRDSNDEPIPLQPTPALKHAREFVESGDASSGCLVLLGPAGTGKTLAAVAALNRVWEKRVLLGHCHHAGREFLRYLPQNDFLYDGVGTSSREVKLAVRRFWYFPALVGALMDPARRAAAMESATAKSLVVIDDLGAEYAKQDGFAAALLDEIVWHREANECPTVITSNMTPANLKARLGPRIADRLGGEWGRIFTVGGRSLRTKNSQEEIDDRA